MKVYTALWIGVVMLFAREAFGQCATGRWGAGSRIQFGSSAGGRHQPMPAQQWQPAREQPPVPQVAPTRPPGGPPASPAQPRGMLPAPAPKPLRELDQPGRPQPALRDSTSAERTPFRFVSEADHKLFERFLPLTDDAELLALYEQKDRFIYYDDSDIPRAYQAGDSGIYGFHSVSHNFSAEPSEPFGHPNREFPWAKPAGTDLSPNASTFRFMLLPLGADGRELPVVWWMERYRRGTLRFAFSPTHTGIVTPSDENDTCRWVFPVGTVFGEVGLVRTPQGRYVTFQLNTAERRRDGWTPNQYRPFRCPAELAAAVRSLRPDWERSPQLAAVVNRCAGDTVPVRVATLVDVNHDLEHAFEQKFVVDELPDLGDTNLVIDLLQKSTFRSTKGTFWLETEDGTRGFAPTTQAAFSIVPTNFRGGAIEMSEQSCARCHQDTHRLADEFQFRRDWYAHVRGDDCRFSWNPVDPRAVSYGANANGGSYPMRVRQDLVAAGLLEPYDTARHGNVLYTRLRTKSLIVSGN